MSLQRYYANAPTRQADGAVLWHNSYWHAGPLLAKVVNIRVPGLEAAGGARVTAYVQGEPDTWFSQPVKFVWLGRTLNGYLTSDEDGNLICQHCYY